MIIEKKTDVVISQNPSWKFSVMIVIFETSCSAFFRNILSINCAITQCEVYDLNDARKAPYGVFTAFAVRTSILTPNLSDLLHEYAIVSFIKCRTNFKTSTEILINIFWWLWETIGML